MQALAATVTAPRFGASVYPGGIVNVGNTGIGEPVTGTLVISETGNLPLAITSATLNGPDAGYFAIITPTFPLTIPDGGSSRNVAITCTPAQPGPRAATLKFTTNDPSRPTVNYFLACGGVESFVSTGDGSWVWVHPNPQGNYQGGLDCPLGKQEVCFLAANGGLILVTADSGQTFTSQATPVIDDLNDVSCPDQTICYAVGDNGTVIRTADGGAAWELKNNGVPPGGSGTGALLGINCPTVLICYSSGLRGEVVVTFNAGDSWEVRNNGIDTDQDYADLTCVDANTCYTVGYFGAIYKTSNAGASWEDIFNNTLFGDTDFEAITCFSVGKCIAVGQDNGTSAGGAIYTTENDGASWNRITSIQTDPLHAVTCPDALICYAVGTSSDYTSSIVKTTNGGTSWAHLNFGTARYLSSVGCTTSIKCLAIGLSSVLTTADGGQSWGGQANQVSTAQLEGISSRRSKPAPRGK